VKVAGYRRLDFASVAITPGKHSRVNQPDCNRQSDKMFAILRYDRLTAPPT
jgi:hypothetical protein